MNLSNEPLCLLLAVLYKDAQSHVELHFINVCLLFVRRVKCHVNIETTIINLSFCSKVLLMMKNGFVQKKKKCTRGSSFKTKKTMNVEE